MALSPRQSQYLRALGHHAQVIVQIGKNGVTDGVTALLIVLAMTIGLIVPKMLIEWLSRRSVGGRQTF